VFFKKVYADKTLGIDKDARFGKPSELENEINSADILEMIESVNPGAEGEDQGVGTEEDYGIDNSNIGAESKPYDEENEKPKSSRKDSSRNNPGDKDVKPIGAPVEEEKKKKGFLRNLFKKKDKDKKE
jgi:penicillin-binding protein 1A